MLVKIFTTMECMSNLREYKKKHEQLCNYIEKIICVWNNINFKMNLEM